jgi:soluble lytic murein transglycosylase
MSAPGALRERERSGGRPRDRRRSNRKRALAGIAALALGIGIGIAVGIGDPIEDAIKELTLPLRHDDIIRQQARDKDLDPALIAAVIYRESKFTDRTSEAGAQGLMQILPSTAEFVAHKTGGTEFEERDLRDPQVNISYGSWYLRYLLDHYDGNEVAAIAVPETRQYTADVLEKRDEYAERYRQELGL